MQVVVEASGVAETARDIATLGSGVTKLPPLFEGVNKAAAAATGSLAQIGGQNASMTAVAAAADKLAAPLKAGASAAGEVGAQSGAIKGVGDALESAGGHAKSFGDRIKEAALQSLTFLSVKGAFDAVTGAISGTVHTAADFEQSLANVASVTGATTSQLAALRAEALQVGQDTSKSASEAVDAFGELLKAGMSVKDVVGGAGRTVVQLAEATGSAVSEMAGLLSNALNTFQLDASKSADVANTLARAANASAIDVADLGQALQAVGPVAASAGLRMDDFATAMGIMGNHALKGSDAGTSLKTMLISLEAPTNKALGLMKQYNISLFDSAGAVKPFRDVIAQLQGSLSGLNDQTKNMVLKEIFGTDAIRAATILLGEGTKGWDAFTDAMAAAPTVAEMSKARLATLGGQVETLKGTLETATISLGSQFLPALTSVTSFANDHLPAAFTAAGKAFGFLTDNAGLFLPLIGAVAAITMGALIPAMVAEAAAAYAATAAYVAKAAAMVAANPVLAAVGLAVGVVALALWSEARAAEAAAAEQRAHTETLIAAAKATDPLIASLVDLRTAGASLSLQLTTGNADLGVMVMTQERARESVNRLTTEHGQLKVALDALLLSNDSSDDAIRRATDAINVNSLAQQAALKVYEDATAHVEAFKQKATELGFAITNGEDGRQQFTFGVGQMGLASREAKDAQAKLNTELANSQAAADAAAAKMIPFGVQIADIRKKADDMADAFGKAGKMIDELAGRMTGAETANKNTIDQLDLMDKATQAAFSAKNKDDRAQFVQWARDAASAVQLTGKPLADFNRDIGLVASGGPAAAAAQERITKAVKDAKDPLEKANAATGALKLTWADTAKAQEDAAGGMVQSLGSIQASITTFVAVFLAQMGILPTKMSAVTDDVVNSFKLSDRFKKMGAEDGQAFVDDLAKKALDARLAGQEISMAAITELQKTATFQAMGAAAGAAYAAGLRAQVYAAQNAANAIIAKGVIEPIDQHLVADSPSKVMIQRGEWTGQGLVIGMDNTLPQVRGAAERMAKAILEPAPPIIKEGLGTVEETIKSGKGENESTVKTSMGAVISTLSPLAVSLAAAAAPFDELRGQMAANRAELTSVNQQLLNLHRALLLTPPTAKEARQAIQDQISTLQSYKTELTSGASALSALLKEMDTGTTAAEGFGHALDSLKADAGVIAQFGQVGASAIAAMQNALTDDTPAAGAAAATAMTNIAKEAERAGVIGWRAMMQAANDAWLQALASHQQEDIDAALAATQVVTDAIAARAPTLAGALAAALNADAIAQQVGSSWSGVFTQAATAIAAGSALPIEALGRFGADALGMLNRLPEQMRAELGPRFVEAWQAFIADPSREALAELQNVAGEIHRAGPTIASALATALSADAVTAQVGSSWASMFTATTAAITAGSALPVEAIGRFGADALAALNKLPEQMRAQLGPKFVAAWQAFIDNPSQEALATLRETAGDIHSALQIIPEGLARMLPEVRQRIAAIWQAFDAGKIPLKVAIDQVNDITNLIPKNLHELPPAVQAEVLALVDLWDGTADGIELAQRRINAAIEEGKKQAEAALKAIELQNQLALQYAAMAGHAPQQGGQTNYSSQGLGGVGVKSYQELINYLGVRGLTQATTVDEFGTTVNYGFSAELLANYGNNLAALEADLAKRLGVFMDESQVIAKMQQAAAAGQVLAAAGQGHAIEINAANMDKFGGHVDNFGNIVNDMGKILSDRPNEGSDVGANELAARRAAWEARNPGRGPAPFAAGGFINRASWLTDMATGARWGSIAEPGTGGEYVINRQQFAGLLGPGGLGGSGIGEPGTGSAAAVTQAISQFVDGINTFVPPVSQFGDTLTSAVKQFGDVFTSPVDQFTAGTDVFDKGTQVFAGAATHLASAATAAEDSRAALEAASNAQAQADTLAQQARDEAARAAVIAEGGTVLGGFRSGVDFASGQAWWQDPYNEGPNAPMHYGLYPGAQPVTTWGVHEGDPTFVNDLGQIVDIAGHIVNVKPDLGVPGAVAALTALRLRWRREHPWLGPSAQVPFAAGGFVSEPSWLVSMRTGARWGSVAEPGTGGEYVVPQGAMRSMMAASNTGGSAAGSAPMGLGRTGTTAVPPVQQVTNHYYTVNMAGAHLWGTEERKAADYIRRVLGQAGTRQG